MGTDDGIHDEMDEVSRAAAGWTVQHVRATGSTNADLLELLDRGEAVDRIVLRTDHQDAGRGRLDRVWEAPPGANLLTSIAFLQPPERPHALTQAVGLAAVRAVDDILDARSSRSSAAALKWPNDVLLGGRKLAGVLAQRHASGAVVVGIGLNVGWAPPDAASLADVVTGPPPPADVLDLLLARLGDLVGPPGDGSDCSDGNDGSDSLTSAVRERLATIGSVVRISLPGDRTVTGTAIDLDGDGRLVVDVDGAGVTHFDVGDVVHVRPH
ncbi:MAG: biotin--[acetyl-CoA-carboxylase] ligase [Actinomycetota bacterium]